MLRRAVLIALVLSAACKKAPPPGDLPPPPGSSAPSNPHAGDPANPHAGDPANPHAGMAADPSNPHAGMVAMGSGGMGSPHGGSMAQPTEPRALEALADGRSGLGPYSLVVPKDWTAKPVTSSMRAADLMLPGKPGADAELIVYYFGPQGAGSVDDNLDRWLGQFTQADGKKSRDVAKIEKTKLAGQDATIVSVAGHFEAEAMPGADAVDKQGQALLAAIIDSPSGPYYFKLVGAKATVDAQAAAFRAMLTSLKLR
jgi:hypothetical protein